MAWPEADNPTAACSSSEHAESRRPAPVRPDPQLRHRAIEPPPEDRLPAGAHARPRRGRPLTRPDSSSALTWASAMLNLICGASKERVATVYPASATATASVVRPASAAIAASAQAISAPTISGRLVQCKVVRRLHRRIAAGPLQTSTSSGRRRCSCVPAAVWRAKRRR